MRQIAEMITNQDRFQEVVDAIRANEPQAAIRHLNGLEDSIVGEKEALLYEHLQVLFLSKFGFEAKAGRTNTLPLETICGRLNRFPDQTGKRKAEGGKRFFGSMQRNRPDQPLVTIITVVFNNASTIKECIRSVLTQTYQNIEYIVIDGGSDDGTVGIIESFGAEIDYFVSEPDDGLYHAMNKGLMLAKGEYIAFLNADDFYLTDAVRVSVDALQKSNADLSYAGFTYMDDRGVAVVADEGRDWREAMLIDGIMGGHETCFVNRHAYDRVGGYDESFKLAADYHWFTRAFKRGLVAHQIKKNILVMRMGGVSSKPELESSENKRLFTEHFGVLTDQLSDLLYELKYYRHWHGTNIDDTKLLETLSLAVESPKQLQTAILQTVYNRTRGIKGIQKPAEKPADGKLKIAVALTYMTGTSGGAERIAAEAASELARRGNAVTFVSCHGAAGEPYYRIDPSIPFIDLAVHPYKQEYFEAGQDIFLDESDWSDFYFEQLGYRPNDDDIQRWASNAHLWKIQTYGGFFRKHEFDVVISHMPSTFPYTLLAMKGVASPPKQIACLHNAPYFKFYSPDYPAENDTDRHMRLASLDRADKIGVLFDEFKEQMPHEYQDRCVTLTNFISPDILEKAKNSPSRIHPKKIILSVGRLAKQKDHESLLRAFASIRDDHPDWGLHIYGEGPLSDQLEQICDELGLDAASIFLGTRRDIEIAYQNADIFAFPSRFEGFGLTALEAMAYGLPVVAYRECEGVKYLVKDQHNGLFATRDFEIESLAHALETLIKDEVVRAKLSANARQTAQKYTVEQHIDRLENLLESDLELKHEPSKIDLADLEEVTPLSCAILSTYVEGGAGIAAQRLQKGLHAFGHDAMMIGFSQQSNHGTLSVKLTQEMQALYNAGEQVFSGTNVTAGAAYFSSSRAGLTSEQLAFLQLFDVINLHWVENLITPEGVHEIASTGKPVVWTLHDMKPITGGCHYSCACTKYETECDSCPLLGQEFIDYPAEVLKLKIASIPDSVVIVTPSQWLADCARASRVFAKNRVEVIPNGIDLDTFKPRPMLSARQELGLPSDRKLLLFTCHDHRERRKGFAELLETVRILAATRDDIELVTLGHGAPDLDALALPYTALGFVADPKKLSLVYSAVDATILPTLEDNLPNVILESAACGTPTAAFDSGGVSDAVVDGVTGYLAPSGHCEELAARILSIIDGKSLSASCRAHALTHFSQALQASRYAALFDELRSATTGNIPQALDLRSLSNRIDSILIEGTSKP